MPTGERVGEDSVLIGYLKSDCNGLSLDIRARLEFVLDELVGDIEGEKDALA